MVYSVSTAGPRGKRRFFRVDVKFVTATQSLIFTSLLELASYLRRCPELDDIAALRMDMRLGTAEPRQTLMLIAEHMAFEPVCSVPVNFGWLHDFGENICCSLQPIQKPPGLMCSIEAMPSFIYRGKNLSIVMVTAH